MIQVEADVDEEWDSRIDWRSLAAKAAQAAVVHSRFAALADNALGAELSVKFTTDAEVQALNSAYRRKDKATNVLSFPMVEEDQLSSLVSCEEGELLLGDVVLAGSVCALEAQERGIAVVDHAVHLVVHGVLHLLGYDHERGQRDADEMEEVERATLASLGIADPYKSRCEAKANG